MKYEDAGIKTGDLLLVDGEGLVSEIIEVVTGGHLSHVGVFFWEYGRLKIAEFWEPNGYQDNLASVRLPQIAGKMYLGTAPDVVHDTPEDVLEEVMVYRDNKNLDAYGFETLAKVAACDDLGVKILPTSVQPVCSVFAQRCWVKCGIKFDTLLSPSDMGCYCKTVIALEL